MLTTHSLMWGFLLYLLFMNITQEELNEILEYQIETIIRRETTYEFEIIDSPLITIDGKQFIARTNTVFRIIEHQLTSKFNSIRKELIDRDDFQYEMVDTILTAMEFILSFLEEPVKYTKARASAYERIVSRLVQENYDQIWNLLKQGKIDNLTDETIFDDEPDLKDWTPGLQDAEIGKLATGYAESIMNLFDDLFEKIVPSDYKQLAEDKLTHIAKLDVVGRS